MNEENMSLPSYSDLAIKVKALKIKNNILKDKIKFSKRAIKYDTTNLHGKKIKTDAKMRFYNGIASAALFNTVFTLSKPYIPHITYWKGPKHAMRILKRSGRKKFQHHYTPMINLF